MRRAGWLVLGSLAGGLLAAAVAMGLGPDARGQTDPWPPAEALGGEVSLSRDVVINEVAWMGTEASYYDEWIELYNNAEIALDLTGWSVVAADGTPHISMSGVIPARGYFLLERTDDSTVSDVPADWIYSGALENDPEAEVLTLYDSQGHAIDTANVDGGAWPAGDNGTKRTMERVDPTAPDEASNWCTNDGVRRNGLDADDGPINGTPKAQNSCYQPPTIPTTNLSVAKRAASSVRPGDRITYTIVLSNTGAAAASDVVLTDTLPTAVTFLTQTSPFTFSDLARSLVWQLGHVPAHTAHTITATGQVSDTASGTLANRVTAATSAAETATGDNVAVCTTDVEVGGTVYLPLLMRGYSPPPYGVIIEALLYDGLQTNEYDEALLLVSGAYSGVDLTGWGLCKRGAEDWTCADLPSVTIGPGQRLWLARSEVYFARSFGFAPDQVVPGWPRFANSGDEVMLRNAEGMPEDVMVYKKGLTDVDGWDGLAVQPYGGANFAEPGQVLYRILDEETGFPAQDTDAAADWAQYAGDPGRGRRVRYPGWDLERFFQPAVAVRGTVTAAIAPDNAYGLVMDTIRSAEETIEIEAYTLEHYGIVTELARQASRGVTVTVLLEGEPAGGIEDQELWACQTLHATGHATCAFMFTDEAIDVHDRYTLLHAKAIIVDRERLLLGSQNLTQTSLAGDEPSNGTGGSRGVVLVTDAPEIVARAVDVFEADHDPVNHLDVSLWAPDNAQGYGPPPLGFVPDSGDDWITYTVQFPNTLTAAGTAFELVTAPEAALRSSDALLGLVARAGHGDGVYVQQLYEHRQWGVNPTNDPNLRLEAYLAAARRGARVRILLNGGDFGIERFSLTGNIETAAYVNEIAQREGLDLSAHLGDPTGYGIHNKMVLVDLGPEGKVVHVGSINGSESSSKVNREMALQVHSPALFDYLHAMFENDWNHQPPEGHVLISEVMIDPDGVDAGREWVEIYNPTTANVDLSGWYVADVGPPGGEYGSGLYRFPAGATLVAEGVIVLAHQADDVAFTPDYEFLVDPHRDDPAVPNMVPAGSWDGFGLALGNGGDEVLLMDAGGAPVDVVTWGAGAYPGVVAHPGGLGQGHSLERRPPREDTDDCSVDFFERYPPTPGALPE